MKAKRSGDGVGEVRTPLKVSRCAEALVEGNHNQECEKHLRAWQGNSQFVEQLREVPIHALLPGLSTMTSRVDGEQPT